MKAIDDKTLEVQLEKPVPYFVSLTAFPTFLPIHQEYFEEQVGEYGLEENYIIYNGAFKLTNWKQEQDFKLEKNLTYWDAEKVKLEEINFDIVKDKATEVNLYESGQIDRVGLIGEFVDKYKDSNEFKQREDVTVQFLRFNQKNEVLKNRHVRLAISEAMNKKTFVEPLLNNSSRPAYGLMPEKFAMSPDGKDFRKENGNLVKDDVKTAQENWTKAKQELGKKQVKLDLLTSDNAVAKKNAEYLKGELEKNLEGLTVKIKAQPRQQHNI